MFHSSIAPAPAPGGTILSRSCARAFPSLFCKTGFAASMPQTRFRAPREGLCVVKVKLTNAFRTAARPARVVVLQYFAGFHRVPAQLIHRLRQTLSSSRGEGQGCHPGPSRKRSTHIREGFLSALPFWLRRRGIVTAC